MNDQPRDKKLSLNGIILPLILLMCTSISPASACQLFKTQKSFDDFNRDSRAPKTVWNIPQQSTQILDGIIVEVTPIDQTGSNAQTQTWAFTMESYFGGHNHLFEYLAGFLTTLKLQLTAVRWGGELEIENQSGSRAIGTPVRAINTAGSIHNFLNPPTEPVKQAKFELQSKLKALIDMTPGEVEVENNPAEVKKYWDIPSDSFTMARPHIDPLAPSGPLHDLLNRINPMTIKIYFAITTSRAVSLDTISNGFHATSREDFLITTKLLGNIFRSHQKIVHLPARYRSVLKDAIRLSVKFDSGATLTPEEAQQFYDGIILMTQNASEITGPERIDAIRLR